MPARIWFSQTLARAAISGITLASLSVPLWCQKPGGRPSAPSSNVQGQSYGTSVDVSVRDARGTPIDVPTFVRLYSATMSYNVTNSTKEASTAHFSSVPPGEYTVEATSTGYRQVTEQVTATGNHGSLSVYIYLVPESEPAPATGTPRGVVMSPQLRGEVERGLQALRKKEYENARKIFARAVQKAPGNPDVVYFLGVAELGLQHIDLARQNFQDALSLDPNHELTLVSLGELQLRSGEYADAVVTLEKAVANGKGGWRADFELASAYTKVHRLSDAETEASRSVRLAKEKGAIPMFFLGEILYAEGKKNEAKRTWESLLNSFPNDAVIPETKKMLVRMGREASEESSTASVNLPLPTAPEVSLVSVVERTWAPPDLDSEPFDVAPNVNCRTEQILDGALHRLSSEFVDFEKFTATEHIEHQEVDRYGWPGPVKAREFNYVVFVYPLSGKSFYLEESRNGGNDLAAFPTSLATTGLNNLGVIVVQPAFREQFNYSCEGLTNMRGQAAWQVRFEQKKDRKNAGVRQWSRNGTSYEIPIKGRIWVSSGSFAVLRIETDLREPIPVLELTKDHLVVDYGPVKFTSGNEVLWLPWSAEMFMELHGKRYHHRHFLSDYMLFGVDTTHKISKPKELPPSSVESSP